MWLAPPGVVSIRVLDPEGREFIRPKRPAL
jgi:hypothetical protein